MILWQMLSQYGLFIFLTDVIAKNHGRSYSQFWADVIALIFEVMISNFLADIEPILFNNNLAGVITKIYGRSCCQIYFGQMLLP